MATLSSLTSWSAFHSTLEIFPPNVYHLSWVYWGYTPTTPSTPSLIESPLFAQQQATDTLYDFHICKEALPIESASWSLAVVMRVDTCPGVFCSFPLHLPFCAPSFLPLSLGRRCMCSSGSGSQCSSQASAAALWSLVPFGAGGELPHDMLLFRLLVFCPAGSEQEAWPTAVGWRKMRKPL